MSELQLVVNKVVRAAEEVARAKATLHFKELSDDFIAGRTNLYPVDSIEYIAYEEERKLLVVEFMRDNGGCEQ